MSTYYCRLCSESSNPENSLLFSKAITEMVKFCIPEFDPTLVDNPIICGLCHIQLRQSNDFKMKCLEVQNEILERKMGGKLSVNSKNDANLNSPNQSFGESAKQIDRKAYEDIEISENSSMMVQHEKKVDPDDFLNLLESSSNIMHDPLINSTANSSVFNGTSENFYDDTENSQMNCIDDNVDSSLMKSTDLSNLEDLFDIPTEKTSCLSCKTRFADFYDLSKHLYRSHCDTTALFACIICRYITDNMKTFRDHCKGVHRNFKDVKACCVICSHVEKSSKLLSDHMEAVHESCFKSGTFHCNSCDFQNKNYTNFRKHFILEHSQVCSVCTQSFESPKEFNAHLGRHSRNIRLQNK